MNVDRCHRCGGVFFEDGEAGQVFGPLIDSQALMDSTATMDLATSEFQCPADRTRLVRCRVGSDRDHVDVEVCPACKGFWLDAGEGPRLVSLVEADRRARTQAEAHAGGVGAYLFQLFTELPIEVYNPARHKPRFVQAVVVVVVFFYVLEIVLGETFALRLALDPEQVAAGHALWGLLTHGLVHANIWHLFFNLYALYVFGDNVEDRLGRGRFALILVCSVIVGGLAQTLAAPAVMVGISGGVSGLMGAYVVLFPRVKLWLVMLFVRFKLSVTWYVVAWLAFQVMCAAAGIKGVGWFGHLGGFATGLAIGLSMRRRRPWIRRSSRGTAAPRGLPGA